MATAAAPTTTWRPDQRTTRPGTSKRMTMASSTPASSSNARVSLPKYTRLVLDEPHNSTVADIESAARMPKVMNQARRLRAKRASTTAINATTM